MTFASPPRYSSGKSVLIVCFTLSAKRSMPKAVAIACVSGWAFCG